MKRLKYLLMSLMLFLCVGVWSCQQSQENVTPQTGEPQVTQEDPTAEDEDDDNDEDD